MIKKILSRIFRLLCSFRFRLKHSFFRGVVRSDYQSIQSCKFGDGLVFYGSLSVYRSMITFGSHCSVSKSVSIDAENGGEIAVGDSVSFGPRTIVSTSGAIITIGANTSFFSDCIVSGMVAIGKGCLFANNVTVLSGTHQIYGDGTIRENDKKFQVDESNNQLKAVIIEDDCWLGANSVILPGVTLAKGTVVGANTVVTKNFPEYSILGGVPALVIGSRLSTR